MGKKYAAGKFPPRSAVENPPGFPAGGRRFQRFSKMVLTALKVM